MSNRNKQKKFASVKPTTVKPTHVDGLLPPFPENLTGSDIILKEAYKASIIGGVFLDTKIYAFSRRKRGSRIAHTPQAIYANSAMLRASSPKFIDCT